MFFFLLLLHMLFIASHVVVDSTCKSSTHVFIVKGYFCSSCKLINTCVVCVFVCVFVCCSTVGIYLYSSLPQAYMDTLQTQWSWLLQITKCLHVHLKENAAYSQVRASPAGQYGYVFLNPEGKLQYTTSD